VNTYLVADLKARNLWNPDMLDKLKYYDGNLSLIPEIPQDLKDLHKEAFEIDPMYLLEMTARRGKWIDQSQSHNVFMKGTSGKLMEQIYLTAWKLGLKTTYYLRTLAASQIEKSTLDAAKFGFTQKRVYQEEQKELPFKPVIAVQAFDTDAVDENGVKLCKIADPDCEACQ